uniref:FTH domain-containing protein n=1 Tax=Caenorhabditis tropicalis TaxID=1561998 RepID=A0A1I7TZN6_9PELO
MEGNIQKFTNRLCRCRHCAMYEFKNREDVKSFDAEILRPAWTEVGRLIGAHPINISLVYRERSVMLHINDLRIKYCAPHRTSLNHSNLVHIELRRNIDNYPPTGPDASISLKTTSEFFLKKPVIDTCFFLEMPRMKVEELRINSYRGRYRKNDFIHETFDAFHISGIQPVQVKKLVITVKEQDHLMMILPCFQPEALEELHLSFPMHGDSSLDFGLSEGLVSSRVWNNMKILKMNGLKIDFTPYMRHFQHFVEFWIVVETLSNSDVLEFTKIVLNAPNLIHAQIDVEKGDDLSEGSLKWKSILRNEFLYLKIEGKRITFRFENAES